MEQALRPEMSVAGLAMRNQVNANLLRRWMQLGCRRAGGEAALLPVTITGVVAPVRGNGSAAPVEIEVAGAVVRVRDDAAPATLHMVLDALRSTVK